jgi:hypothetical protein
MIVYTWLMRLARDKHSSLVASLVSYEENELFMIMVLWSVFFQICPISYSVRIHLAGKACQGQTLKLSGLIGKL